MIEEGKAGLPLFSEAELDGIQSTGKATQLHPYIAALLSAVPSVAPEIRRNTRRILISGDPPDPLDLPKGCRFASRCPAAKAQCAQALPQLSDLGDDHRVACDLISDGKNPVFAV